MNPFSFLFDPLYGDLTAVPPSSKTLSVQVVTSIDPNDKSGSHGAGAARYVAGDEPLRYAIYFENLATASASAQEVVVADQLDSAKFDLDSFSGPNGIWQPHRGSAGRPA